MEGTDQQVLHNDLSGSALKLKKAISKRGSFGALLESKLPSPKSLQPVPIETGKDRDNSSTNTVNSSPSPKSEEKEIPHSHRLFPTRSFTGEKSDTGLEPPERVRARSDGSTCSNELNSSGKRRLTPSKSKNSPKTTQRKCINKTRTVSDGSESSVESELCLSLKMGDVNCIMSLDEDLLANQLSFQDSLGHSPLHYAAFNGHIDAIKICKENTDCDLQIRDAEGYTPIHFACLAGQLAAVEFLVGQGCDVNLKAFEDVTPLHLAAKNGHLEVVKYLIENCKADPLAEDCRFQNPLHIACNSGSLELVRYLLQECKMDASAVDANGRIALYSAVQQNHLHIVRYWASLRPEDLFSCTKKGSTLLHMAVKWGLPKACTILLEACPQLLSEVSGTESTPIEVAAMAGSAPLVSLLLKWQQKLVNGPDRALLYFNKMKHKVRGLSLKKTMLLRISSLQSFLEGHSESNANRVDQLPCYELCRKHSLLDSASSAFKQKGSRACKVLFVSHRWYNSNVPDSNGRFFNQLLSFLSQAEEDFTHLWIDYCCLKMTDSKSLGAQNSSDLIVGLLSACHMLILPQVAPVQHCEKLKADSPRLNEKSFEATDLRDYLSRGWCQLESLMAIIAGIPVSVCFQLLSSEEVVPKHSFFLCFENDESSSDSIFLGSLRHYSHPGFVKVANEAFKQLEDSMVSLVMESWMSNDSVTDLLPDVSKFLVKTKYDPAFQAIWKDCLHFCSAMQSDHSKSILESMSENFGAFSFEADRQKALMLLLHFVFFCFDSVPMQRTSNLYSLLDRFTYFCCMASQITPR